MADIQVPEAQQMNGDRPSGAASEIGSKRQRRPSVRLGDLGGDPPYDRRPTKHQWKQSHFSLSTKPSKSRNLLSFTSPSAEHDETLAADDRVENLESVAVGSWKAKDSKKRGSTATKRVRTNWVSKVTDEGGGGAEPDTDKYSGGEDLDDDYHHGYDVDNSDSPLKEQSPIHSSENNGRMYRRPTRLIRRTDHHDGVDFSGPSDTDMRDRSARWREDGVRVWLNGLGLGRYAPVFEIHEVDDEVLPMLTLEDLKDMGINAVGSRRKMYSAIQKLGKGFS